MRIEFFYTNKNPIHCAARDFVRQFVRERGLLATVEERVADATSAEPVLVVDGLAYPVMLEANAKTSVRKKGHDFLAAILEEQLWCL